MEVEMLCTDKRQPNPSREMLRKALDNLPVSVRDMSGTCVGFVSSYEEKEDGSVSADIKITDEKFGELLQSMKEYHMKPVMGLNYTAILKDDKCLEIVRIHNAALVGYNLDVTEDNNVLQRSEKGGA